MQLDYPIAQSHDGKHRQLNTAMFDVQLDAYSARLAVLYGSTLELDNESLIICVINKKTGLYS